MASLPLTEKSSRLQKQKFSFKEDLRAMLIGMGDGPQPSAETKVNSLAELFLRFIIEICYSLSLTI